MTATAKPVERIVWMDVCKGICIVLVVYGHISGGLGKGVNMGIGSIWMQLRDWVYLFHMPTFFALSGIFAPRLLKLSSGEFLLGRLRTIVYPYVVWTAIFVVTQIVMVRYVNNPLDLALAARFLVEPIGYGLWFLYSLFLISTLVYFLMRCGVPVAAIFGLSVVLSFLGSRNVFDFWPILNTSMSYSVYFAAAAYLREKIFSLMNLEGWLVYLLAGAFALLAMTILHSVTTHAGWLLGLTMAGLGICGAGCLARALSESVASRFWAFLGIFSLEIYLGHPLWGTLSRVLLHLTRTGSPAILVLGGVLLGVFGSLAVGVLCRRLNFPYLFQWPAAKNRTATLRTINS